MQRPLLLVALLLAAVASGCLTQRPPSDEPAPGDPGAPADGALPPGCGADRLATPHVAGGLLAPVPRSPPAPRGCLVHLGVDAAEPTIGIDADGTVYYYPAAVIDRDTPAAAAVRFLTGVARSDDEGATWRILLPTAGPVTPTHQVSLDPYLYLDPATGRIWADDLFSPNCSVLSWSDDKGETWSNSVGGCVVTDHQTIFAGPPVTSTTIGYPNILYRCAINAVALDGTSTMSTCAKSLDGGLTNVPTGEPAFVTPVDALPDYCSGAVGHGTAGPDGAIYLPKGHCGVPMLAISRDEGLTWTRAVVADRPMAAGEHDAGIGVDADGNLHYLYIADDRLPYLVTSRDGGATWGQPLMVGAPGLREAHLPAAQSAGAGKVAWAYYGSFDAPLDAQDSSDYAETTWEVVVGMTVDALAEAPLLWSANATPPGDPIARGACNPVRCNQAVKDFIHLEIGPDGTPWVAVVDGCIRACATGDAPENDGREAAVARLWGGPSLRDSAN